MQLLDFRRPGFALYCSILQTIPATAQTLLFDFESGLPERIGDVGWVHQAQAEIPPEGNRMAFLTTFGPANFGGAFGQDAVPIAELQNFANLPPGSILYDGRNLGIQGSAVRFSLELQAGDQISFAYKLLTDEPQPVSQRIDFAWFSARSTFGPATFIPFANTSAGGYVLTRENSPLINYFSWEGTWQTFTWVVPEAEKYTLAIGVTDGRTNQFNSGLLLDALTYTAVSEPAHPGMVAALLYTLLLAGRRLTIRCT